jgi:hypothetical protein
MKPATWERQELAPDPFFMLGLSENGDMATITIAEWRIVSYKRPNNPSCPALGSSSTPSIPNDPDRPPGAILRNIRSLADDRKQV